MKRFQDSPPHRPRPLETDIDYPPRSVNGDINRPPFGGGDRMGVPPPPGMAGPNGNKRSSLPGPDPDVEGEAATPSDTMLSKAPLPDDDDEEDLTRGHSRGRRATSSGHLGRMASRHGLTRKGLLLLLFLGSLCILLFLALLVMGAMWPQSLGVQRKDVCLTPDCLRASAQVSFFFAFFVFPFIN